MTELTDPVVRTFRIPRDLYVRIGSVRGLESLNGEVVRRLEASFPKQHLDKCLRGPVTIDAGQIVENLREAFSGSSSD